MTAEQPGLGQRGSKPVHITAFVQKVTVAVLFAILGRSYSGCTLSTNWLQYKSLYALAMREFTVLDFPGYAGIRLELSEFVALVTGENRVRR
jgi:hypothetical protein